MPALCAEILLLAKEGGAHITAFAGRTFVGAAPLARRTLSTIPFGVSAITGKTKTKAIMLKTVVFIPRNGAGRLHACDVSCILFGVKDIFCKIPPYGGVARFGEYMQDISKREADRLSKMNFVQASAYQSNFHCRLYIFLWKSVLQSY